MQAVWIGLLAFFAFATSAVAQPAPPSQPIGAELRVTTEDGVSLRVVRTGRASDRAPLLLVSGWTIGLEIWQPVIEDLARDRLVYLLDSRSQGGSSLSLTSNTPEDRARDIGAVIARLGISRPIVVAWSQGVQDVSAYVLANGDSALSGIILVDALPSAGPAGLAADPAGANQMFERLNLYRRAQADYLAGMMAAIISRPDGQAIRRQVVEIGRRTPATIGADMLTADLYGRDRSAVRFQVPLMVVAAGGSGSQPLARWAEARGAAFVAIDDAAHTVFVDQPGLFSEAVRGFLRTAARTPAGGGDAPRLDNQGPENPRAARKLTEGAAQASPEIRRGVG
jgi:pimeloyl-ACP methyl ester carboxylesterase